VFSHKEGYRAGTTDLYLFRRTGTDRSLSVLIIRPRFVGLAARPRAATLQSKAGGRCAPRLGDCGARAGSTGSAGCAGRSLRSLRQSGGGEHAIHRPKNYPGRQMTPGQKSVIWLVAGRLIGGTRSVRRALLHIHDNRLHRFKARLTAAHGTVFASPDPAAEAITVSRAWRRRSTPKSGNAFALQ